ncbi:thiamine pyrophosphate-binding protein [Synechococcus sp. 1G10]|uniref:thiamine pyrophosphate-binding protein n=1 Tax=Synechococcus sp. 1G10 TaxID=2025605 RepID=UPI000B98B257|nr:thiamine pyrophosphate-binding protein [Synechococcus sp. 1G10]
MRGHEAILRQFECSGFRHMFGNPGTVEQGMLDAISEIPSIEYVLTLQESIAVLCADGYARASRSPALVQIHSSPGLGNAIGNLYQAKRGQSPLVVIGGDAGIRYQAMDSQMAADLVAMAEPVTKWSAMVMHPSSLLRMVRRAIKVASTPPCGPVYLCVPQDILNEEITEQVYAQKPLVFCSQANQATIESIIDLITKAKNPIFLVGDGVAWSEATDELVTLAERVGARVYEADGGEVNFPETHQLYFGSTGHMFGDYSLKITTDCDFCLAIGCYLLPEVFPHLGDIFSAGTKVVHIDANPDNIAKNHRVDHGIVGDPKGVINQIIVALDKYGEVAGFDDISAFNHEKRKAQPDTVESIYSVDLSVPDSEYDSGRKYMASGYFFQKLGELCPENTIIFDEALTNSPPITKYIPADKLGCKLWTRGGSLGSGFPGAIGIKLAKPESEVIGVSGDGGCMYTIQCLWTAARHSVAAKFIVCQNRSYRLLQANIKQFWMSQGINEHSYPLCFDLSRPEISFEDLAKGMGVEAERVWKPSQVSSAIQRLLNSERPYLINLVLEGDVHPELIGVHCGQ